MGFIHIIYLHKCLRAQVQKYLITLKVEDNKLDLKII